MVTGGIGAARSCRCPLSSQYCKEQRGRKGLWFQMIQLGDVDWMAAFVAEFKFQNEDVEELLTVRHLHKRSSFHLAVEKQAEDVVRFLLNVADEENVDDEFLSMEDEFGMTPFLEACRLGNLGVVQQLVDFCTRRSKTKSLETEVAIDTARQAGQSSVVEYLTEKLSTSQNAALERSSSLAHPSAQATCSKPPTTAKPQDILSYASADANFEETLRTLSNVSFFALFDAITLKRLAVNSKRCTLTNEQFEYLSCFLPELSMFVVVSGTVEVEIEEVQVDDKSKLHPWSIQYRLKTCSYTHMLRTGDSFGERMLLVGDVARSRVRVQGKAALIYVDYQAMYDVLVREPKACSGLAAYLANQVFEDRNDLWEKESMDVLADEILDRMIAVYKLDNEVEYSLEPSDSEQSHSSPIQRKRRVEVPLIEEKRSGCMNLSHLSWLYSESADENSIQGDRTGVLAYMLACKSLSVRARPNVLLQLMSCDVMLSNCFIFWKEGRALAASFRLNSAIQNVNLAENFLYDDALVGEPEKEDGILSALSGKEHLSTLNLSHCRLGKGANRSSSIRSQSFHLLADLVKTCKALKILILSGNYLTDRGVLQLCAGLQESSSVLETLVLPQNMIGNRGAKGISDFVRSSKLLSTLDLSWNQIVEDGCTAIFEGMTKNEVVSELNLSQNRIGHDGGVSLSNMLKTNKTLKKLQVSSCHIPDTCGEMIAASLFVNDSICELDLSWNQLSSTESSIITAFACCKANRTLSIQSSGNCELTCWPPDRENPSGHYRFDLSQPHQVKFFEVLKDLGRKHKFENWRNETVDGRRFYVESSNVESLKKGIVEFDFVQHPVSVDRRRLIDEDSFKVLIAKLNKSMYHVNKLLALKEACREFTFRPEDANSVVLAFDSVEQREDALVCLYARLLQVDGCVSSVMMRSFRRAETSGLQARIGPLVVFDEYRVNGCYWFDFGKEDDRKCFQKLLGLHASAVEMSEFLTDLVVSDSDENQEDKDGNEYRELFMDALREENKSPEDVAQDLFTKFDRFQVEFVYFSEKWDESEQEVDSPVLWSSISPANDSKAKLPSLKRNSVFRSPKFSFDKLHQREERTNSLPPVAETKKLVPAPRRRQTLANIEEQQKFVQDTKIRREVAHEKASRMIEQACVGSPVYSVTGSRLDRGKKKWKPWVRWRRMHQEDFVVQHVSLSDKKQGNGLHEVLHGALEPSSCVNYVIDLAMQIKLHTIPRYFSVILSPAHDLMLYVNVSGYPYEDDHIWKGHQLGSDLVVIIEPNDPHYSCGTFFVSVVSAASGSEFDLSVQLYPYSQMLQVLEVYDSRSKATRREHTDSRSRKVQELKQQFGASGKVLRQVSFLSNLRTHRGAAGARLQPKPVLHIRSESSMSMRETPTLTPTPKNMVEDEKGDAV